MKPKSYIPLFVLGILAAIALPAVILSNNPADKTPLDETSPPTANSELAPTETLKADNDMENPPPAPPEEHTPPLSDPIAPATPQSEWDETEDIELSIKENSLTPTGLTLIWQNNSDKTYIYGEHYYIEQMDEGLWARVIPTLEGSYAFHDIAYGVNPHVSTNQIVDWEWLYGSLPKGRYRLVKDYSYIIPYERSIDYTTAVGFEISD